MYFAGGRRPASQTKTATAWLEIVFAVVTMVYIFSRSRISSEKITFSYTEGKYQLYVDMNACWYVCILRYSMMVLVVVVLVFKVHEINEEKCSKVNCFHSYIHVLRKTY